MLIYKHIGNDDDLGYGIDGAYFANEIQYLNEVYPELECIKVRINSVGGSVSEGLSICSAILNSKIPVDTYIDGMAFSMAGVIAMCGRKKYMADFATFMMHNVGGSDNNEVVDLLTTSLATIFERTTALTLDKCKELMNKETWMSAEECYSMGLINEIVKTTTNKAEAMNKIHQLHAFYNKSLTQTKPTMNKLTNLLKLKNDASEDAIVESVEALQSSEKTNADLVNDLRTENQKLKDELAAFKAKENEAENAAKLAEIENAIKEGKILETAKDEFKNSPMSSTQLKNLFAGIKPAHSNIIKDAKVDAKNTTERADWTFTDWSKKDPKGLAEMQKNDPASFNNLVSALPKNLSANYDPSTDKRF